MSGFAEIISSLLPRRQTEQQVRPPEPLTPQAVDLWKAIAPNRKPDPREIAILHFQLSNTGVKPQTEEQDTLLSLLRRYDTPHVVDGNPFEVTLSVVLEPSAEVSFKMRVWAPTPPELDHPVLVFTELPESKDFNWGYPYNMLVTGETDAIYTDEWNNEFMGYDPNEGHILWQPYDGRRDWSSKPIGDVEWRRKFASGAIEFLTQIAISAGPGKAAEIDRRMYSLLEEERKLNEAEWKSVASRWERLWGREYHHPWSVWNDNLTLLLQRRREYQLAEYESTYGSKKYQSPTQQSQSSLATQ